MSAFKTGIIEREEDVLVKFTIGVQTFTLIPILKYEDEPIEDTLEIAKFMEKNLKIALNNLLK